MSPYLLAILCVFSCPHGIYADALPVSRVFAFANRNQLPMGIGGYDPKKGWVGDEAVLQMPEPGEAFTLYTMAGPVAQVKDIDERRPHDWQNAIEWKASISSWYHEINEPYALAVSGMSPLPADAARSLPLDQTDIVAAVSSYLKKRGLDVPAPYITQAFEVTLSSGGPRSLLIAAHSDASVLRDDEAAAVYGLALLLEDTGQGWKVIPLAQQTSYKPRSQSIDEHERYHGTRDFYRFLACLDLNNDGRKEIILYDSKVVGTDVKIFTYDGRHVRKVLSAFKHLFN